MSDSTPVTEDFETTETAVERFARIYGTPERGQRLWEQWMETQTDMTRAVMEKVAADTAQERGITIDEGRTYLALQKLIADRGIKWVERYLNQQALAEAGAHRTLQPMAIKRKSRR